MRRATVLFLSYWFLSPLPAYCWWETGHQAIARIAAVHLTPEARTRVAQIFGVENTPAAVAEAMTAASTWADETKAATRTGEWHFIDLALQDGESDIPARCPENNCAPARIRLFAAQLASRHFDDTRWSDLDALRYVIHLVGDIHQPLHTISDADLGGNCERLDPLVGNAKNLHALWDGPLVDALNADSRVLAHQLEEDINGMPPSARAAIATGNEEDWVWESHELAIRDVYEKLRIPIEPFEFPRNCRFAPAPVGEMFLDISNVYVNDMKPVVREQLIRAGLRLANLLNQSL